MRPSGVELEALVSELGSNVKVAERLGVSEKTIRRWRRDGDVTFGMSVEGNEATIEAQGSLGDLDGLLRDRGLDPSEWLVTSAGATEREVLQRGEVHRLQNLRVSVKRRPSVAVVSPARHVPPVKPGRRAKATGPRLFVVESDHQAPYFDPALDAAATAFCAEVRPAGIVFAGDLLDFPTISRHDDHPAAMATVQECIDEGYGVLRRRCEAAPDARKWFLRGNHDWRLEGELLKRAERMHGVAPAGESTEALSLRRLLHLEALGVEYVTDRRGWEHAEVELVPGRDGLVVRHGLVTGHNTAGRTLAKLGRSVIVGHDHSKESVFRRDPVSGLVQQATVAGTMSRCDEVWPHFVAAPDWHQGFVTVSVWDDGRFLVEHAVWQDGSLFWRDRRY